MCAATKPRSTMLLATITPPLANSSKCAAIRSTRAAVDRDFATTKARRSPSRSQCRTATRSDCCKPFYGVDGNLLVDDLPYNREVVEVILDGRFKARF
jgi:hypothetical protein